ncbi:MAG: CoA-transferase [Dehalococcoidia bacterium]
MERADDSARVRDLEEAIADRVHPEMMLHIDPSAQAAVRAMLRVFRGTQPNFTIAMSRAGTVLPDLLHAGLVRKVIAGGVVNAGVRAGGSASLQQAYRSGTVEFEHWSLYSIVLRFMAGALGWPFVPVRSIAGSTMAERNGDSFAETESPFDGSPASVMRPLLPDLSLLHVAVADVHGAALSLPPYEGDLWGARASRNGTILVAERIADADELRKHPHFVQLLPSRAHTVCPAPFAGHPYRVSSTHSTILPGYRQDGTFLKGYERAVAAAESHERWLEEWVYSVPNHDAYLDRVGRERLAALATPLPPARAGESPTTSEPTPHPSASTVDLEDCIVIAVARRIVQRVVAGAVDTVLVGNGLAALPCAVAYVLLRELGQTVQLVRGTGAAGWTPSPGRSETELATAMMLCGTTEAYGVLIGGQRSRSLAVLSAAQIDRFANLNSTELHATHALLTGSGGANDAASLASDVIVVARNRPGRFVRDVDFVTAPGDRVSTVISDLGVLVKELGKAELRLSSIFHTPSGNIELIQQTASVGGWTVRRASEVTHEPAPTAHELAVLARTRGEPTLSE